jgi:hypothetical protein
MGKKRDELEPCSCDSFVAHITLDFNHEALGYRTSHLACLLSCQGEAWRQLGV